MELKRALAKNKKAATAFEALCYSYRKEFADLVGAAKQAETHMRRARKAIPHVLSKTHAI